jgi:hypothetical protein
MRSKTLWLVSALVVALILGGGGGAQPPGKKGGPGGKGGRGGGPGGGFGRGLTVDQIVERIMSFDKNNDGKVTKEELPERMQHLIAMGDTNKDGALDKNEIRELATTLAAFFETAGPRGPGGFGPGGFGGGRPGPRGGAQAALDDLKLSKKTRTKAESIIKAHQEKVRQLQDQARSDLLAKMKEVLSEEDLKTFTEALDRQPRPPTFGVASRQPDIEKKLDQLQKEVEDLRRQLQK